MAGVDDLRREEREHVILHVAAQIIELLIRELLLAQVADILLGEERAHALVGFLVVGVQLVAASVDGLQLLSWRHAGFRIDDGLLQQREVGERTDAHHEELLQVAPEDGDEVQTLQKRHRGIGALVEHALVEIEPGKLAVLHIRRLHDGRRCGVLCCLCIHGPSLLPLYSRWPKNQAAHRNMRDLCILPFFGRLPEIWQRDVNGPGREWPDASVRSWDSRQNRPLQARRPEAIHTISLADSSQLLVEREERSSIAPRNNEIEHVVDRVVILNGRMDRF